MNYKDILLTASHQLVEIKGKTFGIVDVKKPTSIDYAVQLSKIISKLSPLVGNLIEFSIVDYLNQFDWNGLGKWRRQDPGFPDAIFDSSIVLPNPGIEIKAWFPLATEITARFRDSVTIFKPNHINMALIAWLPEYVIFGRPQIIDVLVVSGKSVAKARDKHYHKPPHYIVIEPEDTSRRTGNLQQTNTMGYKFQEDKSDIKAAQAIVDKWEKSFLEYSPKKKYQELIRQYLQSQFNYRLDTNYAKIDRIEHEGIESFKKDIMNRSFKGLTIKEWGKLINSSDFPSLEVELNRLLHLS